MNKKIKTTVLKKRTTVLKKRTSTDKIAEIIYENPEKTMTVREIAGKADLSKSAVQKHLETLQNKGILNKQRRFSSTIYAKFIKSNYFVNKMHESGFVDLLVKELHPSCIILFGSFAKGESIAGSDIDIFVETLSKKKIDMTKFERKLKHPVQLFVEKDIKKLPTELFNNIINGIKLYGYFDAR